jgi:hypothetical protein
MDADARLGGCGAQIDDDLARPAVGRDTAATEDDRLDDGAVGQGEQDHVNTTHEVGNRGGTADARRARPVGVEVVAQDVLPSRHHPAGHAATHVAEADDAYTISAHG